MNNSIVEFNLWLREKEFKIMKVKQLDQLVVMKSWVRKKSKIEPNDNKWQVVKEDKVAKEVIQLLIDELDKNYNEQENVNEK